MRSAASWLFKAHFHLGTEYLRSTDKLVREACLKSIEVLEERMSWVCTRWPEGAEL